MYTVLYRGKEKIISTSWNDLTKSEFLLACKLFGSINYSGRQWTEEEYYSAKCLLARKIIGIRYFEFFNMTAEELADIICVADFMNNPPDLSVNHFPSLIVGPHKLYGPEERLSSSSFDEFISADTYFVKMINSKDIDLAYKLIASLYRQKQKDIALKKRLGTWDGDTRQPFNSKLIESRAKLIKRYLKKKYVWAILYFYWGFRQNEVLRFENLFDKPPEDENKNQEPKQEKTGNQYGWAGTLLEISGQAFGNLKETSETNWFTVMVELSRQIDVEKKRELQRQRLANKKK